MDITYRKPISTDGAAVHALIKRCPPLDQNSLYCNLLQCTDFSETSIVAENPEKEVVGFISGYASPTRPCTLFVWQVAVDSTCRGQGIAQKMLTKLFHRHDNLTFIETTISPSNHASRKLFQRFFDANKMNVESRVLFESGIHFQDDHEEEVLYLAGPAE